MAQQSWFHSVLSVASVWEQTAVLGHGAVLSSEEGVTHSGFTGAQPSRRCDGDSVL